MVESARVAARVYGINSGRRDIFAARRRRASRRQAAQDSETDRPAPLLARVITGGLCGASLCAAAGKSLLFGALLGRIGGVIGAFVGYDTRRRLVNNLNIKDFFVAICEDLIAIGLAWLLVSR
jgi:uncharacterized membrane protein